jgi:hypothetical protein
VVAGCRKGKDDRSLKEYAIVFMYAFSLNRIEQNKIYFSLSNYRHFTISKATDLVKHEISDDKQFSTYGGSKL